LITTIIPASEELRKYIAFFYYFNADKPRNFSYLAFPHTVSAITFFKGVDISRQDYQIHVTSNPHAENKIDILGRFTRPVELQYSGDFDEITIIFKPLGVNRFIAEDLATVAPSYSQLFYNGEWHAFSDQLFNASLPIEELEQFLLARLKDRPVFKKIHTALDCFENREEDLSVAAVAALLDMNLKSFQRLFTKHMSCTPSDYKRIARFRNSLNSKIHAKQVKSLTSISHENNYFDQSYFIKEFKKLTNQNPKKFFKAVKVLNHEKLVWELL
jgi:AraC-like DNA-binding protein